MILLYAYVLTTWLRGNHVFIWEELVNLLETTRNAVFSPEASWDSTGQRCFCSVYFVQFKSSFLISQLKYVSFLQRGDMLLSKGKSSLHLYKKSTIFVFDFLLSIFTNTTYNKYNILQRRKNHCNNKFIKLCFHPNNQV